MAFPPSFLDELRNRLPLAAIVGRTVKLARKGREYQGLCPFHNEKTPSFTVNEDKGFFHCFGCGAHGDAIGFEMRAHHLSFTEAVERLAAEAGMALPAPDPEAGRREARRATLHDVLDAACAFFEAALRAPEGREGLAYLKRRGLSDDTIARFRLGWAPQGQGGLKAALAAKGAPEALLAEAGLVRAADDGRVFDMFRGRVTFPITDRRGRPIAFGARTLGDGQPKYLNSPDTPLFHKGATLYGLAQAREPARAHNRVVAVEGYMDVIALHQAGFDMAVAPLGTALTEDQIAALWALADEPTLCFDGDAAGQRAMARAATRALPILAPGKSLGFAILPAGDDPDSLVRSRGLAALRAVIDGAQPLIDVIWRTHAEGRAVDTPERRAGLERDLMRAAGEIGDAEVRRYYQTALKDRLWQAARRPFGAKGKGKAAGRASATRDSDGKVPGMGNLTPPTTDTRRHERWLLALVIEFPGLLDGVAERLGNTTFSDSTLDNLRRGILKHLVTGLDLDGDALRAYLRSDGFSQALESLLDANEYKIARPDALRDAKTLWEHVFSLYQRSDLRAEAGQAADDYVRDWSPADWARQAAILTSRVRTSDIDGGE